MKKTPFSRLDESVQDDIREYLPNHTQKELDELSPRACIDAYLTYNGIQNFTNDIIDVVLQAYDTIYKRY